MRRWIPGLAAALLLLTGCQFSPQLDAPPAAPPSSVGLGHVPTGTLDPAAATAALGGPAVAAKGSLAGYDRDCGEGDRCVFGPRWADVDRNGCDQRNDVLHRDLADVAVREGTHGCVVEAGALDDPYTGATVPFAKAAAAEVPIDHVVPLAAAWTQGAARWTTAQRTAFTNDLATSSPPPASRTRRRATRRPRSGCRPTPSTAAPTRPWWSR